MTSTETKPRKHRIVDILFAILCWVSAANPGVAQTTPNTRSQSYAPVSVNRPAQILLGTVATASEVCSIFDHPLFSETGFVDRGPMRAIRAAMKPVRRDLVEDPWGTLIDSDGLANQWFASRTTKNREYNAYNGAGGSPVLRLAADAADDALTTCLKNIRADAPERYKNIVSIFKSTPFPLATCLDDITQTSRAISNDGTIIATTTTRRSDRCYDILPNNIYNDRLYDLLDMVLLKEAHSVLTSLLDEAQVLILADNESEKIATVAKEQERKVKEAGQKLDKDALGPEFEELSSATIVFDGSPGMGGATDLTIGHLARCTKSTPRKPTVTASFHRPNMLILRTVATDGLIEQSFSINSINESTKIAIPVKLYIQDRANPQNDLTIENGRLLRPSANQDIAVTKTQEAFSHLQVIGMGMCGCNAGGKCGK